MLQKCQDEGSDFFLALLNHRNTPRANQLGSPAQRLFSRLTRTLVTMSKDLLKPKTVKGVPKKLKTSREVNKRYYDKTATHLKPLKKGDAVRMQTEKGYRKSATIKEATHPRSYTVERGGKTYRRNRRHLLKVKENIPVNVQSGYWLENYLQGSRQEPVAHQHETPRHQSPRKTPQRQTPQSRVEQQPVEDQRTHRMSLRSRTSTPAWMQDYVC